MISVVVAVYKVEKFLARCVESLLSQNFSDMEIILVDDGSPDGCPKICDEYAKNFSNVRVIHKKNCGLVSARKSGLEISKGDFILYIDGDDWAEPEFLNNLWQCQKKFDADIVIAGFTKEIGNITKEHKNILSSGFYDKNRLKDEVYPIMMLHSDYNIPSVYSYVWNKLFRKTLLCQVQMRIIDNITIGEDAALTYPALIFANKVYITNDCSYHYVQRADSMLKSAKEFHQIIGKLGALYKFLTDFAKTQSDFNYLQFQVERYILFLLMSISGGVVSDDFGKPEFIGYENFSYSDRIAIYAAGTTGQHLYNRLKQFKQNLHVVKWVDPDYEVYREHGLNVDSVDSICDSNFDTVLIAMMDRIRAGFIKESLNLEMKERKMTAEISEILPINLLDCKEIFKKFNLPFDEVFYK